METRKKAPNGKFYTPGTSPDEIAEMFQRSLTENREAEEKLTPTYKHGEGLEEVISDDHLSVDD